MILNGNLSQSVNVSQSAQIGGITYAGNPAVSLDKQVKSPDFTKAWHRAATISGATTFNVFGVLAVASGTLTYGTPTDGSTVVVSGPTGGPFTFTKVAAAPAANQFSTIAELTALIEAIDGLAATDDGLAITITVTVPGTAPNAWTLTGTDSYATLSITFSGGAESDLVDPFGDPVNFAVVKALVVKNDSALATLVVGGGADALLAALPTIPASNGSQLGLAITVGSGVKNLLLTPSAELAFALLILGT